MRTVLLIAAATLAATLAAAPAAAHEAKKGAITVEHPLVRAPLGRAPNTAGYAVIRNAAATPDRLVSVSCACAARVEMHSHVMDGQVAQMRKVEAVAVPARGQATFAPGAYHLMISGLRKPLEAGSMVNLTLRFDKAGAVTVPFFITARVEQELKAHRAEHGGHAH